MAELWRSIVEYVPAIARAWWQLAIGVLAAGYGVATQFHSGLALPGWAAAVIAVAALVAAQFRAFHQVRLARDRSTSARFAAPMLGLVNEFSGGRYWPNQLRSHVEQDEDAFVMRVILGPRHARPDAQLGDNLKDNLRSALQASPLEGWLQRYLHSVTPWALQSPSTHYIVTVARSSFPNSERNAELAAYSQFQLPAGPQSAHAALLIDLVVREDQHPDGSRLRFTLGQIYELSHLMLATALDAVAPTIFPLVTQHKRRLSLQRPAPPIGPNLYLVAFGQKNLADFIDLTDLQRVPGADLGRVNTIATIETPRLQRLHTFAARDQLIRQGLTTILAANEFLKPETAIQRLSLADETRALLPR